MTDKFTREWVIEHSKKVLEEYPSGITIRQLYYRLVAIGMINDYNHYKRVVTAMVDARWGGIVDMTAFIDRERAMCGETKAEDKDVEMEIERGKEQVDAWMNSYRLNRWSNQEYYVEVWIEKKALQGVFETPCHDMNVGLAPCKGYPSITFLYEASERFKNSNKIPIILYFGDHDASGDDIPRSLKENLIRMGVNSLVVERIALNITQIREMDLPGVPPKVSDTRTRNWDGGSVVELDSIEPHILEQMCRDAITRYFDEDKYQELKTQESVERALYQKALKDFVNNMEE